MANPLAMMPHALGQTPPNFVYGEVSGRKPAPASFTDPLYVIQPDWSIDHYWTIVGWPALHGATLPAHGAAVLLVRDSRENWRCVWWNGVFTPYYPIFDPD